jgi:pilus assembly protein CpaB
MSPRQLIVLVIAAIAAVGALLLIRSMGSHNVESEAKAGPPIAGEQVLVAARDIAQGAAVAPSDLAVALFPEESISPSFIKVSAQPSAQSEYVGAVTRRAFARGEPITAGSIVQPDGRGFMAAQLAPGFRAVAIEIEPGNAVGGYVQPNDHVDVIATARVDGGSGQETSSSVVVEDVRVLALGDTTQTQSSGEAPQTIDANVAVLEMTAEDARAVALARKQGDLSLALRGVQAETVGLGTSRRTNSGGPGGAVRMHAFGSVVGGGR